MKALKMKQLDEKDEKIAETLISLGMNKKVAMTLTYLQNMNAATSIDIERGANLHQPEVSMVMKQLKERDWISEREERTKIGKGRPKKVYSLKLKFNDIVNQLAKQHEKVIDETRASVERLKELGKNNKN